MQNFGHLYHAEGVGGAENWRRHLQSADRGSEGNENGNENTKKQIEEDMEWAAIHF